MKENISNLVKTSGKNVSYWTDTVEPITFSKLNKNIKCDVAVIGGPANEDLKTLQIPVPH